jgi:hypothetical protein
MNLELDTFEYEEDLSIGTLQMEQVENGTKIIVELFPENQSKESFEDAEFSQVYDLLELAPCCIYAYENINHPVPEGTTEEQKEEVARAILRGVESMLETTLNLQDLKDLPVYPIIESLKRNHLISEIMYFVTYQATEPIDIEDFAGLSVGHLQNAYKLIDTINETDEERTQHLITYLKGKQEL